MLLRSNLLSYLLCRADAVSDERSESITKDSGRFPRRTCGSPRNDDFIFPLPSRRSDGKRSAAITSFPQKVFKDLRDFKEDMSPMRRTRPPHRRQRHPACALCRNYRDAFRLCRCVDVAVGCIGTCDAGHLRECRGIDGNRESAGRGVFYCVCK